MSIPMLPKADLIQETPTHLITYVMTTVEHMYKHKFLEWALTVTVTAIKDVWLMVVCSISAQGVSRIETLAINFSFGSSFSAVSQDLPVGLLSVHVAQSKSSESGTTPGNIDIKKL